MIEKMKKLTLLVSEKSREDFLRELRKAGVIHIRNVKEPVAHDIQYVEDRIDKMDKMIFHLRPYAGKKRKSGIVCGDRELVGSAEQIASAYSEKEELLAEIRSLEVRIKWFDVWGQFDPETLTVLKEKGAAIKLYRLKKDDLITSNVVRSICCFNRQIIGAHT